MLVETKYYIPKKNKMGNTNTPQLTEKNTSQLTNQALETYTERETEYDLEIRIREAHLNKEFRKSITEDAWNTYEETCCKGNCDPTNKDNKLKQLYQSCFNGSYVKENICALLPTYMTHSRKIAAVRGQKEKKYNNSL